MRVVSNAWKGRERHGRQQRSLSIARAYHRGWTTKNFDEAIGLLSGELKVEVPINNYPTRESFAKAVAAFGSMTTHVALLAEFGHDDQAMLLYDMDVEGLGRMRVAEHFTIGDGQITRFRYAVRAQHADRSSRRPHLL
jgi:hypothetical protein